MANETKKPALYLAEYDTPNAIAQAAMKVRDAGYQKWDCHTPYAMHGMDEAMGLKPTRIGGAGYPLVVGGKPPGAFPSMVPIMFELGVLFCEFATLFGLLHIIKLPRHNHPIFESDRFEAASNDKFFISIEAGDQKFDLDRTKALLEATNPTYLELVEEEVQ